MSDHFSITELTFSQYAARTGTDNTPNDAQVANLNRLCDNLLEPIRSLLHYPIHVDSGFRSPAVNAAVGGAANSAHLDGRAADLVPIGMSLAEAFDAIRESSLPYDQCIFECQAWIHVSVSVNNDAPRRQILTATGGPGNWHYEVVT